MNFFSFNLLYMFYSVYVYISFRMGMEDFLRYNKHSKSYITKKQKGWKNYWFYKDIHSENDMGLAYYLNAVVLIATALFCFAALFLSWASVMRIPVTVISVLLCIVQMAAVIFSFTYSNKLEFGKPLVWFAKKKHTKGIHTSILDIIGVAVPIIFALCNVFKIF